MTHRPTFIASLIGPTLIAVAITEGANLDVLSLQTAPVVYLNGALLFVAGLAIVRAYNTWRASWTALVPLVGWGALFLGLWRMLFPAAEQAGKSIATYSLLAVLLCIGVVMTFAAYRSKLQLGETGSDK